MAHTKYTYNKEFLKLHFVVLHMSNNAENDFTCMLVISLNYLISVMIWKSTYGIYVPKNYCTKIFFTRLISYAKIYLKENNLK